MPSPETLNVVREQVKTAEAAINVARDEARKLRSAGLTSHADELDRDITEQQNRIMALKRAYQL